MRRLFIAEKPNVGAAIAEVMPGAVKQRTHYVAGNDIITWCFGHILEQAMPEDYNPAFKNWSTEHLPIVPPSWKLLPKEESAAQLKAIKELLGQADVIVNAGDADREGQLLVEEVLHYLGNKKPVKRVLITDNNPGPVKQALAAIKDNSDQMFQGWYLSALARSRFDWLFGLNLTRAYTLAARRIGFELVGAERVVPNAPATTGSEDFAFMLERRPGCYLFIGNGAGDEHGACMIHNPGYDFNDGNLPIGAAYWALLAETYLQ